MVEKDRKELNKRFQRVYELLEQRGEIVNNHPDKSKSAFAEKLLGSKQYDHISLKCKCKNGPVKTKSYLEHKRKATTKQQKTSKTSTSNGL